ncbi:hypothetical protein [Bacillus sonorensis]|uniref:hypothetical protein n=1 Tax=Bacillus sonorensis TaxID=119858 RepID=UPI000345282C|nr:hypothetical protein [Bacillus sonorensis]TWK80881.1 hypothetical protein CHCC20335_0835 [Bacillus paralicheniformis]
MPRFRPSPPEPFVVGGIATKGGQSEAAASGPAAEDKSVSEADCRPQRHAN